MNISKTRGPIAIKFYLKHLWVQENSALGFGPDRIRTLVSVAARKLPPGMIEENRMSVFSGLDLISCH